MNSYKDLTNNQIKRIISLSRYGLKIKVIADKVKASYSQVYQYYKINNYSVKVDLDSMSGAEKAHFTRFIAKKQVAVEHRVHVKSKTLALATETLVSDEIQNSNQKLVNKITKYITNEKSSFFIPANKNYYIESNSKGTTITYY